MSVGVCVWNTYNPSENAHLVLSALLDGACVFVLCSVCESVSTGHLIQLRDHYGEMNGREGVRGARRQEVEVREQEKIWKRERRGTSRGRR